MLIAGKCGASFLINTPSMSPYIILHFFMEMSLRTSFMFIFFITISFIPPPKIPKILVGDNSTPSLRCVVKKTARQFSRKFEISSSPGQRQNPKVTSRKVFDEWCAKVESKISGE